MQYCKNGIKITSMQEAMEYYRRGHLNLYDLQKCREILKDEKHKITGKITEVDQIYNYYGKLKVMQKDDGFYWGIGDWDNDETWHEIPEELYKAIINHI